MEMVFWWEKTLYFLPSLNKRKFLLYDSPVPGVIDAEQSQVLYYQAI